MLNYTPHPINIIDPTSCRYDTGLRKWVSDDPKIIKSIPSSGVLSAKIEAAEHPVLTRDDGVPTYETRVLGIDPPPPQDENLENDIIIVSALYAAACKASPGFRREACRLRTVYNPVYTPDGKTVLGCLGVALVE